jgi:uncharacterized coiled-coil protein SlyX
MNNLKSFFWFCSGANQSLLNRCPTESSKYVGIGATVLFTGILAALSSGYALYTVFESFLASLFFAIVWGAMIFNLDRFIVCSMKKRGNLIQEFKVAIPRLILAILLALVISKPLELKIFEKEINKQIDEQKNNLVINAKATIAKSFPEIDELNQKITGLKNQIDNTQNKFDRLTEEANKEADGTGGSGHANKGPIYKAKADAAKKVEVDLDKVIKRNQPQIEKFEKEVGRLSIIRGESFDKQKPNIDKYDGLAARIDALGVLTSKSSAMDMANLFIILLFIAIETSPIFTKLISSKGPYDDLLEKHEHSVEIYKIEQMSKNNQKTNERLEIIIQSGNNAVTEELEGNRNLMKRIVEAETELAQEMINQWKDDEMEKIKNLKSKKGNNG